MSGDGVLRQWSEIKTGSTVIASYTYDAEGRRVSKATGGVTTYFVYDAAGQLMAEYGGPTPSVTGTQYYVTDYLGSTRMVLNGVGGCLQRMDYAPFGGQITRSGQECYGSTAGNKPMFTGQMRDEESAAGTHTGLDYFNARYMWAAIARFTSPDAPLVDQHAGDPQSWNLYAYVRNNPLRFVDPTGRDCVNGISSNMEREEDNGQACFIMDFAEESGSGLPVDRDKPKPKAEDVPLGHYAQEFYDQMSARREASNQMIAAVAAGSAATGAALAVAPIASQALNEVAFGPAVGRIFWSGRGAMAAAEVGALASGGRIISQTPLGSAFARYASVAGTTVQNVGWSVLSRMYAYGAGGSVTVYLRNPRAEGVWQTIEAPILMRNANVFKPLIFK